MARRMYLLYLAFGGITQWGMSFHFATYVMFLLSRGLSILDASLVNTAYAVTLILAEFPTGVIADTWGRKASFIVSCFLIAFGTFVYAFAPEFLWFVIAEVIIAIGMTCTTGAFDAWIVDTITFHEGSVDLGNLFTRAGQVRKLGAVFGVLMGSYAAEIFGLQTPWIMSSLVFFIVGVVAVIYMKEEHVKRNYVSVSEGFKDLLSTAKKTMSFAKQSRHVVNVLLIVGIATCAMQAYNMQWQPFFKGYIQSASQLGWFFVAIIVFSFIGISISKRIIKNGGNDFAVPLIISLIVIGVVMICTSLSPIISLSIFMFLMHEISRGSYGVFADAYMNAHIPSEERASLLSLQALAGHVGMAIGLPISGWIADNYSIRYAWLTSSIFLVIMSGGIALRIINHKKHPVG
ncbi:MFS transporter [Candidatus Parcubacteria bacterium]|nr:MAG: MFS transporter [Candidatus Parcubacteria bacterium]